jgi:cytochrome b561
MSSSTPTQRLNSVFKQLMSVHWWMAICFLFLLVNGIIMSELPREVSFRELMFATHKSVGVTVLLLLGWRVYLLLRVWGAKYRKHLPKLTRNWYFKTALHTILYLMMFVMPISGYWLSNAYRANNISLFGIPMPDIFPLDSALATQLSSVHSRASRIFAVLIIIHFICQHKVVKANWRRFSNWVLKFSKKV